MEPTIPSDDIKKRIASLKEELDRKKAKLKRSLRVSKRLSLTPNCSVSPHRPKRVRFSDTALSYPAEEEQDINLNSYVLSQNLFDDSQLETPSIDDVEKTLESDVDETSSVDVEKTLENDVEKTLLVVDETLKSDVERKSKVDVEKTLPDIEETSKVDAGRTFDADVALLSLPCSLPVSRCSAVCSVSSVFVCLWWTTGARLFHIPTASPPVLVWLRDCLASSLLLIHLSLAPDATPALLVAERRSGRLFLNCLLLDQRGVVSVVPMLAEDYPNPEPGLSLVWGDGGELGALCLTVADRCWIYPLSWTGREMMAGGGKELPFGLGTSTAVGEERAVFACLRDGRCQLGVMDLRQCSVRRCGGEEEGRLVVMGVVGRERMVMVVAGVWERREGTEVVLDALHETSERRVRLRRMWFDVGIQQACLCGPGSILIILEEDVEKVEVDWSAATLRRRRYDVPEDVRWMTATGATVLAWRRGETVEVVVKRESA